jgi:HlyD family secretion protein
MSDLVPTKGRGLSPRQEAAANRTLLEFQSPTIALVAKPLPAFAYYATYVLASMLVVFLVLAGTIPIDRVVTATGRVVSQSNNMLVQPLEASIVRSIEVAVGQRVHTGDLLARLDPTFTGADMVGLQAQTQSLQAEVDRLKAEAAGTLYMGDISPPGQLQAAIYKEREAERSFKLENYRQKISSLESALAKAKTDMRSYGEQLHIASDMLDARQRLEREGVGSKFNTQQALSTVTDQRRAMDEAMHTAASAKQDMDALSSERDGYIQQFRSETSQQLIDASRKLDDAIDQLTKAKRRHDLVDMRADRDATVLAISPVSVGSVLNVAEPFITLVPDDATLEIDAAIPATDVGFVRVGDQAVIKFDAYPFFQHGYAEGHVRVMAPDSQATPTEGPDKPRIEAAPLGPQIYRVKIAIDTMKLTNLPPDFHLQPGLGTEADIKVGRRTMLSYLLARFVPTLTEGMREP